MGLSHRSARQAGLVKDRQRLLDAADPFAAKRVAAERARTLAIRTASADLLDEERLLQRVAQLRQIVGWANQVSANLGLLLEPAPTERRTFAAALVFAHQILADRDDPDGAIMS